MDEEKFAKLWALSLLFSLFMQFRGFLVDKPIAKRCLELQGYHNVQITDRAGAFVGFRGCDATDAARFTAEATNPAGQEVEVYVCTGWLFKGATIRTK